MPQGSRTITFHCRTGWVELGSPAERKTSLRFLEVSFGPDVRHGRCCYPWDVWRDTGTMMRRSADALFVSKARANLLCMPSRVPLTGFGGLFAYPAIHGGFAPVERHPSAGLTGVDYGVARGCVGDLSTGRHRDRWSTGAIESSAWSTQRRDSTSSVDRIGWDPQRTMVRRRFVIARIQSVCCGKPRVLSLRISLIEGGTSREAWFGVVSRRPQGSAGRLSGW